MVDKNRKLAEIYKNDLEQIAQGIPEVSFYRELNESSTKELPSILDKLANRTDQYSERGYSGVVRDGVRATIFMPDANKGYTKIVKSMEKKDIRLLKLLPRTRMEKLF